MLWTSLSGRNWLASHVADACWLSTRFNYCYYYYNNHDGTRWHKRSLCSTIWTSLVLGNGGQAKWAHSRLKLKHADRHIQLARLLYGQACLPKLTLCVVQRPWYQQLCYRCLRSHSASNLESVAAYCTWGSGRCIYIYDICISWTLLIQADCCAQQDWSCGICMQQKDSLRI